MNSKTSHQAFIFNETYLHETTVLTFLNSFSITTLNTYVRVDKYVSIYNESIYNNSLYRYFLYVHSMVGQDQLKIFLALPLCGILAQKLERALVWFFLLET